MSNLIIPIKAFKDNYIWLGKAPNSKKCFVVDPGDAQPVLNYLNENDLQLECILITHHHYDHTGGVNALKAETSAKVYGPINSPFSNLDQQLKESDSVKLAEFNLNFNILSIPGHTLDHIAYYDEQQKLVFCGDTLFSAGCGRIFEGNPQQMYQSLQKLVHLPNDTQVFCAHEYTLANLEFALEVEPDNAELHNYFQQIKKQRENNLPSLPSNMKLEQLINPFLRCENPAIQEAVTIKFEQKANNPIEVFTLLREWKNNF